MKKNVVISFVGNRDPFDDDERNKRCPQEYPSISEENSAQKRGGKIRFDPEMIGFCQESPSENERDEEGAIITLCRHLHSQENLAEVHLFPSGGPGGTFNRGKVVKRNLEKLFPEVQVQVTSLGPIDPTDFVQLSEVFRPLLQDLVGQKFPEKIKGNENNSEEYKFHVNCSSGTQQMTALLYALLNAGYVPGGVLWQIKDPRNARKDGVARERQFSLTFLEEETILDRLQEYAPIFAFEPLSRESRRLGKITLSEKRRLIARALGKIFKACNRMDMMRIDGAVTMMDSYELPLGQVDLADKYKCYLQNLKETSEEYNGKDNICMTVELCKNMERCLARGAYADVLSRVSRILEAIFKTCVKEAGISIDSESQRAKDLKRYATEHDFSHSQKKDLDSFCQKDHSPHLGLHNAVWLAHDLLRLEKCRAVLEANLPSCLEYKEYKETDKTLYRATDYVRKLRNEIFIAHSTKEILQWQAEFASGLTRHILESIFPETRKMLLEYPITEESIRSALDIVKNA